MKKKLFFLIVCLILLNQDCFSQCAMCKAVVETNLDAGDTKGAGLNDGILFLMSIPYIAMLTFAVFYFFQKRNESLES